MKRSSRYVATVSALALAASTLSTGAASASTIASKATFCGAVASLTSVPVLELPSSIDFGSIITALNSLSADQNTLRRDVIKLNTMTTLAPSPTLKSWYGQASASAVSEIAGLQNVLTNATTLLNGSKSNRTILSVAAASSSAASEAAVANTYLSVAKPVALSLCAHWPGTTPAKPVVKHKPVVKPKRK
jgi:hypothetical protein